jgi:NADH-quinone oxidoreductase subunit N
MGASPFLAQLHQDLPALQLPRIDYSAIMPELILIGLALVLMTGAALTRRRLPRGTYAIFTVAASGASMAYAYLLWNHVAKGGYTAIAGSVAVDGFSVFFIMLIGAALIVSALSADAYLRRERLDGPEFYVLAMLSASGAMFMAAANDLIVLFLGLEILSIALYVMAGYHARRRESGEAAIKYFVLGAFSSAIFLYGVALTYGATGSTNLGQIAKFLAQNVTVSNGLLLAGMALLLVGLGFKVAAVPFHFWTPDVYQGSPTPVTGFMAATAKAAGFAGLLRLFFSTFSILRMDWKPLIWALALLTLLVGAVVAIVQRDVKRMLAYSSISHAGFVLVGLEVATKNGIAGGLYYLFAYVFMVVGSFTIVTLVGRRGDARHDLDDYRGLFARNPGLALLLSLFLMAQAGIPFTTGFLAKFYVISAAVSSGAYPLALIAMIAAVIAAFFYLRVIVLMYSPTGPAVAQADAGAAAAVGAGASAGAGAGGYDAGPAPTAGAAGAAGTAPGGVAVAERTAVAETATAEGDEDSVIHVPLLAGVGLFLSAGFTVFFGLYPAPLIDFAHRATLLF